ncbi:MAG: PD-(D/E)XK nuclease family protein [Alistipes sp.]|nr:PD-(D/E)XK nuclease family protein [Alistipes sp.]
MQSFLGQVASDLYGRYGDGISSLHTVFPSRRAALFFGDALSELIERPLWQPSAITIDALMEELSGLTTGDRLRLVTELFRVYGEFHPTESFDSFYFWGELLLSDFDSIDKYLVDADALFSNLVDLRELDHLFDMEPEARAAVERFWSTFSRGNSSNSGSNSGSDDDEKNLSPEQKDFLAVWRTLGPVYHRFRARLRELGIAYQGMVYREAAERIRDGRAPQIPDRHYVIAGFNALGRCEQTLFDHLRGTFRVDFYWDHDSYFTTDPTQEAGMFMRDNLRRFPPVSKLSGGHDNFVKPKTIRSVSAASDVLQCKYAGLALSRLGGSGNNPKNAPENTPLGKETAVVLCDESLLTPLLWSMPPEVANINITMGYPLRMHPAYTFVERLIELQNRRRTSRNSLAFYHSDVHGLLRHPYLSSIDTSDDNTLTTNILNSKYVYIGAKRLRTTPLFELIFSAPEGWQEISDYLIDTIAAIAKNLTNDKNNSDSDKKNTPNTTVPILTIITDHIRTLANSLSQCDIALTTKTYATLLRRSLQSVTIPFEGEPLDGVQVMGILETRALDFDNIIFLSSGDSTMPGSLVGAPSFIPYNLKAAYGLPTPEHHEGVYAYHFFRLISRARHIELVWSRTSDDRNTGTPSRYILQLDYESPHTVEHDTVTVDVNLSPTTPISVEKSPEVMSRLGEFLRPDAPGSPAPDGRTTPRRLSPSLFFTYVECPLKFYFRGVARLRPDDEVTEGVDSALLGNIFHRAMQLIYTPLTGLPDPRPQIRNLIGSPTVEAAITQAAAELYAREENPAPATSVTSVTPASVTYVTPPATVTSVTPDNRDGTILLAHRTISDYINRSILPFDASQPEPFTIDRLEHRIESPFRFDSGTVVFSGIADRIDSLKSRETLNPGERETPTLRVVDYKTGSPHNNASALLQMSLYSMMLQKGDKTQNENEAGIILTSLYYVRDMTRPDWSPPTAKSATIPKNATTSKSKTVTSETPEFEEDLRTTLAELFDPQIPFTQTPDPKPCEWCDFRTICQRVN